MQRRHFLSSALTVASMLVAAPLAALSSAARAQEAKKLRIGYQKNGVLLVAKQQKILERRFAPQNITVEWVEFSFGPPLLEALGAGSIDYGTTGDAPPVFAQAARAHVLYVAAVESGGSAQGLLVHEDSPIMSVQDLKGKKLGFAKASSAHDFAVAALDYAGLSYGDITPVYLAPADGAAAFARKAIDAWSIWDPYFAIAQKTYKVRVLDVPPSVSTQNSYFLANRDYTLKNPQLIAAANEELAKASSWIESNRRETAKLFSDATGVDLDAMETTVGRSGFAFVPMSEKIIAEQQAVADRFAKLALIPNPVSVRDIVWDWKSAV